MTSEPTKTAAPALPMLPWWPFLVGDALLLGLAAVLYWQGGHPPFGDRRGLTPWEGAVIAGCVTLGCWIFVTPFLLQYRAWTRWAELGRVDTAVQQIQNIDQVSRQIGSATTSWQAMQVDAAKTMQAAQGIMERMSTEARAFTEFIQKANESERQHLRLELEKLHRAEAEWLQALVRILDHVFALHAAAVRSGQVNLVEQVSHFQRACRDAAQRVGLAPITARGGEAFDPELHQSSQPPTPDLVEPKVAEIVATGYRFQGRLLRKVLVTFQPPPEPLSISQISQRRAEEQAAAQSGADDVAEPSATPVSTDAELVEPTPPKPAPASAVAQESDPGMTQTEFTRRLEAEMKSAEATRYLRVAPEDEDSDSGEGEQGDGQGDREGDSTVASERERRDTAAGD